MSTSCPYCGAFRKLKFCVVCGRYSKVNKMGHLRSTGIRNTDATQRLEDPFSEEDFDPQKSLRFHSSVKPIAEALIGGLLAGTLIFCAAKQALDFYGSDTINAAFTPWMNPHRYELPKTWVLPAPLPVPETEHKPDTHKRSPKVKNNRSHNGNNKSL